jgi:surface antigen
MAMPSLRWCLVSLITISGGAVGYGELKGMPSGYFDKRDLSLMEVAVVGVLEDENAKVTRTWSNTENGHSGTVTSLRAFKTADGRPCKKLQIDSSAEGYKSSARYDICLHHDGNWREAESGVPFGKATLQKAAP